MTMPVVPPDPLPPLATSDDYVAIVGGEAPDGIDEILAQASASVRRYCGWHIAPVIQEVMTLDGNGLLALRLPTMRLVDVLAVSDPAHVPTPQGALPLWTPPVLGWPLMVQLHYPSQTDALATPVEWSTNGMIRRADGYPWTYHFRGVVAEVRHGFDQAAIGDVTALVVSMAARGLASSGGSATQATVGQVTVKAPTINGAAPAGVTTMADYELAALDAYRLFGVA